MGKFKILNDGDDEWAAKEIIRIGKRFEDAIRLADSAIEAENVRRMRQEANNGGAVSQHTSVPMVQGEMK